MEVYGSTLEMESTNTVTLNTKGFCPFCLKRGGGETGNVASKTTDEDGNAVDKKVDTGKMEAEIRLRQQFSKVLPKYLGVNFSLMSVSKNAGGNDESDKDGFLNKRFEAVPLVDVGFICIDCSIMVEKLCRLFHEWKKLEIELDWTARQLKNIMAFAKRAPSRKRVFREQFSNSGTREDMEELERIEMFRKEILDKCSSKFRKLQPRVVFKRKGDPMSTKSRRRSAKRKSHNPTLHDVEVQTEPIPNTLSSPKCKNVPEKNPEKLDANSQSTPGKGKKRPADDNDDDYDNVNVPSPAPPSPAYSSDVVPVENEEEPPCFLRIRNIESLASPTKSVCAEESPVRKTRSSTRISASNPVTPPFPKIVDVAATQPTASSTRRTRATDKRKDNAAVLETVPDLVESSSLASLSSNFPVPQVLRKATLTEWLQSTFNCQKCQKMFISEATLSVHKTTCGVVVEETRQEEEPYEQDDDNGETPMNIDANNDDSSEEEEDPLGNDQETDMPQEPNETEDKSPEPETATKMRTNTYEIRILKKDAFQAMQTQGSQYCKYCKASISKNHFTRHRQTLKHKLNKKAHKKAKKLGQLGKEVGRATGNGDAPSLDVVETNGTASSENNAATAPAAVSSTAVVTVTQDENNRKVVKIIYVTNKDANNADKTVEEQQKGEGDGSKGESRDGEGGGVAVAQGHTSVTNEVDVIDISDD